MPIGKIDSNATALFFSEETSLRTLAGSPIWYGLEPNDYNDSGADIKTVSRKFITSDRQLRKGAPVGIDVPLGYAMDWTNTNHRRLLQGFMFADMREKATTQAYLTAAVPLTSVAISGVFNAASGLTPFKVGMLVKTSGFTNAGNNGFGVVTAASGTQITVSGLTTVAEASPPAGSRLDAVGFQLGSGLGSISLQTGQFTLVAASGVDFTTFNITPGEWHFFGGDTAIMTFATGGSGYARVKSVTALNIVYDKATFTAATDAGTGKTVQVYFGDFNKNENTLALIKRRSYMFERQLGVNSDVGALAQCEYLEGSIPNKLGLELPLEDKVTSSLEFVGMNASYTTSAVGPKAGTRVAAPGEAAINTAGGIYRVRLSTVDPTTLNPAALIGYATTFKLEINNNVKVTKALGVFGGFDSSAGFFEVTGQLEAYFTNVTQIQAIKNNLDVTLDYIFAASNAGFVVDLPLLALGGGKVNIKQDDPMMIPVTTSAAVGSAGYTLGFTFFDYLPNLAMPSF